MGDEWKRAEVLLEEIRKDVKTIAEGHGILERKIDEKFNELKDEFGRDIKDIKAIVKEHSVDIKDIKAIVKEHSVDIKDIKAIVKEHSADIKDIKEDLSEIKHDLKEHIHQTAPPAHVAV